MTTPAIVGTGFAVPANIRTNDDPIFDWLKKHNPHGMDLFKGYKYRRVLSREENLDTIMVPAALRAMEHAKIGPADVDLLIGYGSVSPYETPNELARLHQILGLDPRVWVLPLNNEFSNFNAALWLCDGLVRTGRIKTALLVIGGNWTHYVDYHTPQAVSASDGAAAAVMRSTEEKGRFHVVDSETCTDSSYFGTMYMAGDPVRAEGRDLFTGSTFHITDAGQAAFQQFGVNEPPKAALRLLARNGLTGADVTLISHQASSVLLDAWGQAIAPAQYPNTLEEFGNMAIANIPVTLACFADRIEKDHLVLLGIGSEMHTNALLLRRG